MIFFNDVIAYQKFNMNHLEIIIILNILNINNLSIFLLNK